MLDRIPNSEPSTRVTPWGTSLVRPSVRRGSGHQAAAEVGLAAERVEHAVAVGVVVLIGDAGRPRRWWWSPRRSLEVVVVVSSTLIDWWCRRLVGGVVVTPPPPPAATRAVQTRAAMRRIA